MATPDERGSAFEAFPLLAIPIMVVAASSIVMGGADLTAFLASHSLDLTLGGSPFKVSAYLAVLVVGTLLLMWEIVRAAYDHTISVQNHALSAALFLATAFSFFQFESLRSELFLFLVVLTFIDVVAGAYITLKTRSRKIKPRKEVVNITADISPRD